jgi:hypothetical protein
MKTRASIALVALAGALLAWWWRSPGPAQDRVATSALDPLPTPEAAAGRAPRWTPFHRSAHSAPGPAAPLPAPRPALPVASEDPPRPAATEGEAAASRSEPPLWGHAEWTRRLLLWAASEPDAAAAWAEELTDPAQRLEALQAVCFKVAEKDPAAALALAEKLALEEPVVIENLVAQWAAADAYAALDWVEHRPPGEARDALISRVAFALAASEPHEAVRLVQEGMPPGPAQQEAAASVVHQWRLRDPAAAADWVDRLAPGPLRERARRELAAPGQKEGS